MAIATTIGLILAALGYGYSQYRETMGKIEGQKEMFGLQEKAAKSQKSEERKARGLLMEKIEEKVARGKSEERMDALSAGLMGTMGAGSAQGMLGQGLMAQAQGPSPLDQEVPSLTALLKL